MFQMEEYIMEQVVELLLQVIRIPVVNIVMVREIAVAVMEKVINSILIPAMMILARHVMEADAVLIVVEQEDNGNCY